MQITDIYQPSGCTCHCDNLFRWVAGASRRARESDRQLSVITGSCKNAYFPIDRARRQLSGLSVVQPPKSESRLILCETQANGVALVLAVPGTRPLRGVLDSSCCFAREGLWESLPCPGQVTGSLWRATAQLAISHRRLVAECVFLASGSRL